MRNLGDIKIANRTARENSCAFIKFYSEIPRFQRPGQGIHLRRAKTQRKTPHSERLVGCARKSAGYVPRPCNNTSLSLLGRGLG